MCKLARLGVLFGHVLESHLLRLEKRILFVQSRVVEKFSRRNAQSLRDGLDDVGGGVLAALLDVAQIALRDTRLVGERLQREVAVRT